MQVTYFHCNQELGKMAVLGLLRHCIANMIFQRILDLTSWYLPPYDKLVNHTFGK